MWYNVVLGMVLCDDCLVLSHHICPDYVPLNLYLNVDGYVIQLTNQSINQPTIRRRLSMFCCYRYIYVLHIVYFHSTAVQNACTSTEQDVCRLLFVL